MGEFELIRRFFLPLAQQGGNPAVVTGPGDDCAIQRIPPGSDLVFSVDTLVEGVHFPPDYAPKKLGWRSLAVAVSDLAAMGADPVCFTLALTLPDASESWLTDFASGLADAARSFSISLAGGDITRGPLTLTLQVHGTVPQGQALYRSGARVGDYVCVSGTLGDAAAAIGWLYNDRPSPEAVSVLDRYHTPVPRVQLGQALRGVANAAIDISDGLLADLGHILETSRVGALVEAENLPLSAELCALRKDEAIDLALRGGDDYELCVTIPPAKWQALDQELRNQLTIIGCITEGKGLQLVRDNAIEIVATRGYDHFGEYE